MRASARRRSHRDERRLGRGSRVARLVVYGAGFHASPTGGVRGLVAAATLAAFVGSFVGARLLGTVTMRSIRLTVAAMLLVVALGLRA